VSAPVALPRGRRAACAVLLAALLALALGCGDDAARPAALAQAATERPQVGRWVARLPGTTASDLAGAAVLAAADGPGRTGGGVLVATDAWPAAVAGAQFAAPPLRGAVLPVERDILPTATADVLARLRPAGFPRSRGIEVVALGGPLEPMLFGELRDLGLQPTLLEAGGPAALARRAARFRTGWARETSPAVAVVSARDPAYALPAAAWSAFSGDPVAFVERGEVPPATRALLAERRRQLRARPTAFLIGPPDVISRRVERELRRIARVVRIGGRDAPATAAALARYRDRQTGFGWGLRRGSGGAVTVAAARRPADAIAALALAAGGPRAPLLLVDEPAVLPPPTARLVRDLARRGETQAFVLGDERAVGAPAVAELEALLAGR